MTDKMEIDMAVTISELRMLADKIERTTYCSEDDMLEDIRICATNAVNTIRSLAEEDRYVYDLSAKCEKYDLPVCDRLDLDGLDELEDLTEAPGYTLYEIASDVLSEQYGEYVKDICHVEAASPASLVCHGIEWDFDTIDREDGPPARRQQPTT